METKITIGTIKFADINPNEENMVMMGIASLDKDADQLEQFFVDMEITTKAPTGVYRILDNVLGDEGRHDWLITFPDETGFSPMGRLQFGHILKWTEDFLANYYEDYIGHNPYLDEDEGPEFDGAGFTEADRDKYSLVGVDGNAFAVMGYVIKAMGECRMGREEIKAYQDRATSGDYDNLLAESAAMIEECNEIAHNNG